MPSLFKAVECKISAINCHECGYRDENVQFEQYPEYINKECPVCKSNLMTHEEYTQCKNILRAAFLYNILVFPIHFVKYIFSKEYRNSFFSQTIKL
jgi:hypothetical protein